MDNICSFGSFSSLIFSFFAYIYLHYFKTKLYNKKEFSLFEIPCSHVYNDMAVSGRSFENLEGKIVCLPL